MNFRPELAAKVMSGEKTVTRRLVNDNPRSPWYRRHCGLVVGKDYAVCPGRGKSAIGRVRVTDTHRQPLGHLIDFSAWDEGFENVEAFESTWAAINGSYDPKAIVWRVEFEAVQAARA